MTWLDHVLLGPMHASVPGRCLRWLIGAIDLVLRRIYGVTEFESEHDGLLRIRVCQVEHDVTLSDGIRIRPGDTLIELHIWNEHFLPFPAKTIDFGWAARIQQQMRCSLSRLALHIQRDHGLDGVRALRMTPAIANRRPADALARLLLMAGFERSANAAPRRNRLLRFLDSLWVWLLTWTYNPRALIAWSFNRTRHEFWISRRRFLMLFADQFGSAKKADRSSHPPIADRNEGTASVPIFARSRQ